MTISLTDPVTPLLTPLRYARAEAMKNDLINWVKENADKLVILGYDGLRFHDYNQDDLGTSSPLD